MGLAKIAQHMQSISGSSSASKERGTAKYKGTHFAPVTSSYKSVCRPGPAHQHQERPGQDCAEL